jgi:hypothetical protein
MPDLPAANVGEDQNRDAAEQQCDENFFNVEHFQR